MNMNEREHS